MCPMATRDLISSNWYDPNKVTVIADDAVLELIDEEACKLLSGAPSWSTVTATREPHRIVLRVQGPVIDRMVRYLEFRHDGTIILRNHVFVIDAGYTGRCFSARSLTVQARAALEAGIDHIVTNATGCWQLSQLPIADRFIGYYVWPRLGFEAPIPQSCYRHLPERFQRHKMVSELMHDEGDQQEWLRHGDDLNNAKFAVSSDSTSWQLLLRYCLQRDIRI